MGLQNSCCKNADDLTGPPRFQQYQQTQFPHDALILQWLTDNNIKINQTESSQGLPNTIMKHILYQRYFVGTWKDSVPQGKVFIYDKDNFLFNGYYHNGQPEGQANIRLIKHDLDFKGTLKNGKADGKGIAKNFNQGFSFEGDWQQSRPKKGIINLDYDSNILSVAISDFITGEAIIRYKDNRIYQGRLYFIIGIINTNKLVPNGKGKVRFQYDNKKNSYEGDWRNGVMHGTGRFIWKDGSEYQGEYVDGRKQGKGKFIFANKNFYDGFWSDGKQSGLGTLYSKTRQTLKKGFWKDGAFEKTLDQEEFEGKSMIESQKNQKSNKEEAQKLKKQGQKSDNSCSVPKSRFAVFEQKYGS